MVKLDKEQREAIIELTNLWAAKGEMDGKKSVFEYCPNSVIDVLVCERIMEIELELGIIETSEVPDAPL